MESGILVLALPIANHKEIWFTINKDKEVQNKISSQKQPNICPNFAAKKKQPCFCPYPNLQTAQSCKQKTTVQSNKIGKPTNNNNMNKNRLQVAQQYNIHCKQQLHLKQANK